VLAKDNTPEGVLEALCNKRTLIWQNGLLRGMDSWLKPFMDASLEFKLIERNSDTVLQVTNKGPLGFVGNLKIDGEIGLSALLLPYKSVNIPCNKDTSTVTITWENVQNAPNQSLITKHNIAF
jgi:hypothetical protein